MKNEIHPECLVNCEHLAVYFYEYKPILTILSAGFGKKMKFVDLFVDLTAFGEIDEDNKKPLKRSV